MWQDEWPGAVTTEDSQQSPGTQACQAPGGPTHTLLRKPAALTLNPTCLLFLWQATSECPHWPRPDCASAPGGAGQDDVWTRGVPDPGGDPPGCVQVGQAQARGCRPVLGEPEPGCFEGARGPGGQTHLPTRVQVASGAGASLSVACSGPGVPDRARQKGHGVNQTLSVHGEADL